MRSGVKHSIFLRGLKIKFDIFIGTKNLFNLVFYGTNFYTYFYLYLVNEIFPLTFYYIKKHL